MASGVEWRPRRVAGSSARGVRRDEADSLPERGSSARGFGPERRLRRRRDFTQIFSGGRRLTTQVVTFVVHPNGVSYPRLGLAVPRRVARRAVARNRLKRRIRESFRLHAEHLGGVDVVVLVHRGAQTMDSAGFCGVLARQWERVMRRVQRKDTAVTGGA